MFTVISHMTKSTGKGPVDEHSGTFTVTAD